jgi:hypothetical protein
MGFVFKLSLIIPFVADSDQTLKTIVNSIVFCVAYKCAFDLWLWNTFANLPIPSRPVFYPHPHIR